MTLLTRWFSVSVLLLILAALTGFSPSFPGAESGDGVGKGEFPDSYYFYQAKRPKRLRNMEGKAPPKLKLRDWIVAPGESGGPIDLAEQKGKVVVVDFWGTWCPPCVKSIPHNIEMYDEYREEGLVFIGVHDSKKGWKKMPSFARSRKINYPLAVDVKGRSKKAWKVSFWPTYFVIDRAGIIRAAGLQPNAVEAVIKKLLAEKASGDSNDSKKRKRKNGDSDQVESGAGGTGGEGEIPLAWNERNPRKAKKLVQLMAQSSPPPIASDTWLNSDSLSLEDLRGQVVLLDFWATWCGPCIKSIPHNNRLAEKYRDEGLVVIGICHYRKVELMEEIAKKHGIEYPICADPSGTMNRAYMVDSYPDYYLIDREGRLRIADCKNDKVEEAIELLLREGEKG